MSTNVYSGSEKIMKKLNSLRFLFLIGSTFLLTKICVCENVKKSVDENRDDNGETNDETKDESLAVPAENDANNNITCTRRQNNQMHEIRSASHRQFPFMAAVMSHQNEYLCSGTVISNGLILTTAHCTTEPISYVLLNTTRDKKDDNTVVLHVIKTEKFPTYAGKESPKDVGLLYTEKHNNTFTTKIKLSNYTSSSNVIDLEALGFGLNAEVGQPRELQYVGLEHRPLYDSIDILPAYFDCIDTKVPTCFKDTGGPAIYDNELYGIVTKGENTCTKEITSAYAINKKMADILATYTFKNWLDEKIKKNEDRDQVALMTYPMKPVLRQPVQMTSAAGQLNAYTVFQSIIIHLCCFSEIF